MVSNRWLLTAIAIAAVGTILTSAFFLLGEDSPLNQTEDRLSHDPATLNPSVTEGQAELFTTKSPDNPVVEDRVETLSTTAPPVIKTRIPRVGIVAGRVENPWGGGIQDAEIGLRAAGRDGKEYAAKTDQEGEFKIEVPLSFLGILSAEAEGFRSAYELGVIPGMDIVCVLEEGAMLRGIILDSESGLPIKSAFISTSRGMNSSSDESDISGSFELGPLEPGTADVDVAAIGYERQRVRDLAVGVGGEEYVEVELRPGAPLAVRIHDAVTDQAVSGARVTYEQKTSGRGAFGRNQPDGPGMTIEMVSNDDGRVFFDRVGIDGATLSVLSDAWLPLLHQLESVPPAGEDLVLRLKRAWTVEGKVVDPMGRLLMGAEVQTRDSIRSQGVSATTDSKGVFRLSGLDPNRQTSLVATHPSYAPVESESVSPDSENVVITMGRPGIIRGTVVDGEGQPIADARLELSTSGGVSRLSNDWPKRQFTEDDGLFEFVGLAEGRYTILASTENQNGDPVRITLEEGGVEESTVTLSLGLAVSGRVIDERGAPIDGCRVSANELLASNEELAQNERDGNRSPRTRNRGGRSGSTRTDSEGKFSLGGFRPDSGVRLTISRRGFASQRLSLVAGTQDELIVLDSLGGVRGVVSDLLTRSPIESFAIEVRGSRRENPEPESNARLSGRASQRRESFKSKTGEFLIDGLSPGGFRFRAHADGYESSSWIEIDIIGGDSSLPLNFGLEPGSLISGQVTGPGGEPIGNAPLFLAEIDESNESRQSGPRWGHSNDQGSYRFQNMPAGSYTIGIGSQESPLVSPTTIQIKKGQRVVQDFRLPGLGSVEIVLRDPAGQVLERVRVRARMESGPRSRTTASSDARGVATFRDMIPGTYVLTASSRGLRSDELQVIVTSGSKARMDMVLRSR